MVLRAPAALQKLFHQSRPVERTQASRAAGDDGVAVQSILGPRSFSFTVPDGMIRSMQTQHRSIQK